MNEIAATVIVRPRSGLIMTMGILALAVFGPLTGIPGWIMANQDLKDIRSGIIAPSAYGTIMTGKILNIVGTFFSIGSLFIIYVFSFTFFITLITMLGRLF